MPYLEQAKADPRMRTVVSASMTGVVQDLGGVLGEAGESLYWTELGSVRGDLSGNYSSNLIGKWIDAQTVLCEGTHELTSVDGTIIANWTGRAAYYPEGIEFSAGIVFFDFTWYGTVRQSSTSYSHIEGRQIIVRGMILEGQSGTLGTITYAIQGALMIFDATADLISWMDAAKTEITNMRRESDAQRTYFMILSTVSFLTALIALLVSIRAVRSTSRTH
jgi:hypothetical protein